MTASLYEILRDRLRAEQPVALATVLDGAHVGAKLLVSPDEERLGTLGHPELDRVVARDALAELEAGVGVHAAFVVRFGKGLLPTLQTVVQEGDLIYASVLSKDVQAVAEKAAISPVDGI